MELNRKHWTKAAWAHQFSLPSSLNKPTYLDAFLLSAKYAADMKDRFPLALPGKKDAREQRAGMAMPHTQARGCHASAAARSMTDH